jgi:hypothetical protein
MDEIRGYCQQAKELCEQLALVNATSSLSINQKLPIIISSD